MIIAGTDTDASWVGRRRDRETYLEPLLHLLDEHVAVRSKAVYGEHGAIGSERTRKQK